MVQEAAKFRLRSYTCPKCKYKNEQFGMGDPQKVCWPCGAPLNEKPELDLYVQTIKTVTPFDPKTDF